MTEKEKDLHDKPLDKMTVTELREVAKGLPGITGVHGMKKTELLEAVMAVEGGSAVPKKRPTAPAKPKESVSGRELKKMIKSLRVQRRQALMENDKKMAKIYRRRISRLKKKTRQAA
ncbi:MAG: Rho termination factor N-terminal domain-containing protein [Desulfobacteraceae bacterium]|jgi:hypothetical protein